MFMKKERYTFMIKLWDTLKNKTKTIHELVKEFPNKTYKEIETYKTKYEKEHKLRQEAEGELTIIKGIGNTSPEMRGAKEKIKELQSNLDRIKKENNDLYNKIADMKEYDLKKARESGL